MREQSQEIKRHADISPEVDNLIGDAYDTFYESNQWSDADVMHHKEEQAKLHETLNDFCGSYINEFAFGAAMLSDIYCQKDSDAYGCDARRALLDCFSNCNSDDESKYMIGLLEDEASINRFWQENISMIANKEDGEDDEWLSKDNVVDFGQLSELISNINLESLLISSAKTLNYLSENNDKSPEVLNKIRQAESMLAPICEIIGFDGLAMALNNASIITRFNNTGRKHYVDQAAQLINMHGSSETLFDAIEGGMTECLGKDTAADYDYAVNSRPRDPFYRTLFVHGLADSKATDGEFDIKGRLKTVGSLAKKLYDSEVKNGRMEIPMDIIATTIVTTDVEQSAKVLDLIIKNSKNNPNIAFVPAPSKESAVYVQGESEFIGKITGDQHEGYSIETKEVSAEDGIQVAKVTFEYQSPLVHAPLRVETQIVTLTDRMCMRYGARCHSLAYKGKVKLDSDTLKMLDKIHGRKEHVGEINLIAPGEHLDAVYGEIMAINQTGAKFVGSTAVGTEVKLPKA